MHIVNSLIPEKVVPDPLLPLYYGAAGLIVLVVVGFLGWRIYLCFNKDTIYNFEG